MKKSLLLLLIVASLVSCKKDDPEPADNGGLRVGSSWVYKYTDLDESGTVVSTSNITATISGEITLGGEQFWVLSGAGTPSYIRKTASGYYDYVNNTIQLQYKIPAAVNDTWRVTYSASVGDYTDFTVKAVAQDVTVPMGTIPCYYIEGYDSNSLEDKQWYNEANSLVKQEEYDLSATSVLFIDFTIELVSFTR